MPLLRRGSEQAVDDEEAHPVTASADSSVHNPHPPGWDVAGSIISEGASQGAPAGTSSTQQPASSSPCNPRHGLSSRVSGAAAALMSTAPVTALVLWIVLVIAWSGFQVVQNALWVSQLKDYTFELQALQAGRSRASRNIGDPSIDAEQQALWTLVALEAALTLLLSGVAVATVLFPAFQSWKQGTSSCFGRTARRGLPPKQLCWLLVCVLCCAWCKCLLISSVWNKMAYQGLFCGHPAVTGTPLRKVVQPRVCQVAPVVRPMRMGLVFALLTIALHTLMYLWHQARGACRKLLAAVPCCATVALLMLQPLASIMNWYYVQHRFTKKGNFTFTAEMVLALMAFISSVWMSLYLGWAAHSLHILPRFVHRLAARRGSRYDGDGYDAQEQLTTGSHQLKHLEEGQGSDDDQYQGASACLTLHQVSRRILHLYYHVGQLPAVMGFVAPIVTYGVLKLRNWWVVLDMAVGTAYLVGYLLLCALHHRLLVSSKASS